MASEQRPDGRGQSQDQPAESAGSRGPHPAILAAAQGLRLAHSATDAAPGRPRKKDGKAKAVLSAGPLKRDVWQSAPRASPPGATPEFVAMAARSMRLDARGTGARPDARTAVPGERPEQPGDATGVEATAPGAEPAVAEATPPATGLAVSPALSASDSPAAGGPGAARELADPQPPPDSASEPANEIESAPDGEFVIRPRLYAVITRVLVRRARLCCAIAGILFVVFAVVDCTIRIDGTNWGVLLLKLLLLLSGLGCAAVGLFFGRFKTKALSAVLLALFLMHTVDRRPIETVLGWLGWGPRP
jgi:hypothetical protein